MERTGRSRRSDSVGIQEQIVAACVRYESAWRSGGAIDIEAFLANVPETVRSGLRRELAALDEELRGAECERIGSRAPAPGVGLPGFRLDGQPPAAGPRFPVAGERVNVISATTRFSTRSAAAGWEWCTRPGR